ncbi:MAG: VWA domain-containing protein, partial [Deltaproteobacteria bacterium]|nr:VWA domain-containing protein [Deltaproteobacteria bacterium]
MAEKATIALGKPTPTPGLDVYLLLDESGSMIGRRGSDPEGVRYEAGKYLLQNLLVKRSPPEGPHRVAIVHFATRAQGTPLIEVTPGNADRMVQALASPTDIHRGYTNIVAALQKVKQLYDQTPPGRHPRRLVVVLFTDGQPDDARKLPLKKYFQEIAHQVRQELPGAEFYVVGLDNPHFKDRFQQTVSDWQRIVGQYHVVTITRMPDLYTTFNQTLQRILEIPQVTPDRVQQEKTFEVQPYLDCLEFHIFYDPRIKLAIYRPDGSLLKAKDPGVSVTKEAKYAIFRVQDPTPGHWKYRIISGQGQVTVFRNPIPFRLTLLQPGAFWPMGQEIYLKAVFLKANGQEIKELPDYPLGFMARVISPGRKEQVVDFPRGSKVGQVYYSNQAVKTTEAGEYTIILTVKGGDRFQTSHTVKTFVQSAPYLDIQKPQPLTHYGRSQELVVEALLERDGHKTDPQKEFIEHPNYLILAKLLHSPDQESGPTIWLSQNDQRKSYFYGVLPQYCWTPGSYRLAVQLAGTPRLPVAFKGSGPQVQVIDFYISKAWPWSTRLYYLGLAILSMIILWLMALAIWLLSATKVIGGVTIDSASGQTKSYRLYSRGVLWPQGLPGFSQEDGSKCPPLCLWARSLGRERLRIYLGGWISLLSMGLIKERVYSLRKDEQVE